MSGCLYYHFPDYKPEYYVNKVWIEDALESGGALSMPPTNSATVRMYKDYVLKRSDTIFDNRTTGLTRANIYEVLLNISNESPIEIVEKLDFLEKHGVLLTVYTFPGHMAGYSGSEYDLGLMSK